MPKEHKRVVRPQRRKKPKADCSASDEWEEFRSNGGDPISLEELNRLDLESMPEDIHISIMDNYFPELNDMAEA